MATQAVSQAGRASGPRLDGQVAIVTGGSSGIGKGAAIALAEAGADVAVNYRGGKAGAEEVVEEIRSKGRRGIPVQADVSSEADVQSMFASVLDELGRIDILVNNAGIQMDANVDEMTLDQWNTVLGVNLTGQFLCAREAVRHFKARGVQHDISCAAGKIICMSSVHEIIPWGGHANYAASKGGLMLFAKSLAQEVAGFAIRVNSIAPGRGSYADQYRRVGDRGSVQRAHGISCRTIGSVNRRTSATRRCGSRATTRTTSPEPRS